MCLSAIRLREDIPLIHKKHGIAMKLGETCMLSNLSNTLGSQQPFGGLVCFSRS